MADEASLTCTLCGTVATGLEIVAGRECREKLNCKVRESRGRIYFDIPVKDFDRISELRAVENVFLVLREFEKVQFVCQPKEEALQRIYGLLKDIDQATWRQSVDLWKRYSGYKGNVPLFRQNELEDDGEKKQSSESENSIKRLKKCVEDAENTEIADNSVIDENKMEIPAEEQKEKERESSLSESIEEPEDTEPSDTLKPEGGELPKFRVTCMRSGTGHKFSSQESAAHFGGAIQDTFGWRVNLSNADIDVLLNIVDNKIVVGIALSRDSLHKRNLTEFGPTSLKCTIAYCLLKLANIKPGDVVCDPMCGGGSIPLEGAICWPDAVHICGDNHELAVPRTKMNLEGHTLRDKMLLDVYRWDVCNLPLRTASIDSVITDLPFGKKSGNKMKNWELYPKALEEMGRVCRPKTSRAILLTYDKKVMAKSLKMTPFWKSKFTYWVNVGGLNVGAYVLYRTAKEYSSKQNEQEDNSAASASESTGNVQTG